MSDLILPDFVGFAMNRKRNPEFQTIIKATAKGREIRQRFSAYPVWHFTVPIEFLLNDLERQELDQLMGFILANGGQEGSWLYDCPGYNAVDNMILGIGDGSRVDFQLRTIEKNYGFIEPVHQPKAGALVFVDGATRIINTDYLLSTTGNITFSTPPMLGAVVTWTGGYYHRCRFDAAIPDFNESVTGVFDYADFSFIGSPTKKLA